VRFHRPSAVVIAAYNFATFELESIGVKYGVVCPNKALERGVSVPYGDVTPLLIAGLAQCPVQERQIHHAVDNRQPSIVEVAFVHAPPGTQVSALWIKAPRQQLSSA
jgi:hypothetical protein